MFHMDAKKHFTYKAYFSLTQIITVVIKLKCELKSNMQCK